MYIILVHDTPSLSMYRRAIIQTCVFYPTLPRLSRFTDTVPKSKLYENVHKCSQMLIIGAVSLMVSFSYLHFYDRHYVLLRQLIFILKLLK